MSPFSELNLYMYINSTIMTESSLVKCQSKGYVVPEGTRIFSYMRGSYKETISYWLEILHKPNSNPRTQPSALVCTLSQPTVLVCTLTQPTALGCT